MSSPARRSNLSSLSTETGTLRCRGPQAPDARLAANTTLYRSVSDVLTGSPLRPSPLHHHRPDPITPSLSLLEFLFHLPVNLLRLPLPHPLPFRSTLGSSFPIPLPSGRGRGIGKLGPAPSPRSALVYWVGQGQRFPRVRPALGASSDARQSANQGARAIWHPAWPSQPGARRLPDACHGTR